MSYILDNKTNLASIVIPVGETKIITVFSHLSVVPTPEATLIPSFDTVNGIAPIAPNFKRINNTDKNYNILSTDYAIDIISDTYTTVTLPLAANVGGKIYVIARTSNTDIQIICQNGDTIDTTPVITLGRKYNHLNIMSNNVSTWYII